MGPSIIEEVVVAVAGHEDAEVDDLAAQASKETDPEKRKELYKQVEQMMIGDEVRIAPFTHDGYTTLTKPFIERGYPTFGPAQWDRWNINQ